MSESPSLALVTGAAQGIGRAITQRLLHNDRRVIALDMAADNLAKLADEQASQDLITCPFDLARAGEIPRLIRERVDRHGPITALVNNAGIWPDGAIVDLTDETWNRALTVNLTAPFALMRALAPIMAGAGGGAIVNIASRNAFRSSTNFAAYDASKAGLVALTRTAAGEFAKYRIRVNAVCPGVISTPGDTSIEAQPFKAAYLKQIPMGRYGQSEEVAGVVCFLLSDDASYITGESITVDGGQIACQDNKRFMEIPGLKA